MQSYEYIVTFVVRKELHQVRKNSMKDYLFAVRSWKFWLRVSFLPIVVVLWLLMRLGEYAEKALTYLEGNLPLYDLPDED